MNEALETNIAQWIERIGNASVRFGGAEICAVTKTVPVEIVNRAYAAGIRTIGENRVQELLSKKEALDSRYAVHLIGRLQTNKVKAMIDQVDLVQSLDRVELAQALNRRAEEAGRTLPVLMQVNIGEEAQKAGFAEEALLPFLQGIEAYPALRVQGLMAILPIADDPNDLRPLFRRMRGWFERLRDMDLPGVQMRTLSMGMSDDCIVAAEEGATMVRLGRALFGSRQ